MQENSDDFFESSDGVFVDEDDFEEFVGTKKISVKDYLKALYDTAYYVLAH